MDKKPSNGNQGQHGRNMIHETAVIDPGAELGTDVEVGPFSYIRAGVRVGDGCVIGPSVTIMERTELGPHCRVHAGAVLGDIPQDTAFKMCESGVRVGADCLIREGVTIHRGSEPGTLTEIGDSCFLMAFSHFAHNVRLGNNVIVANGALLGGHVDIDDKAFISGNCLIHQFVKVGRVAMLGGGCGVSKDVPPFCMVRPMVLNTVTGLNVVGLRRTGMSGEHRKDIKRAFNILYQTKLNVSQAVEKIRQTFDAGPALEFCTFVELSNRGICAFLPE